MKKPKKHMLLHERIRWVAGVLALVLIALAAAYALKLYRIAP